MPRKNILGALFDIKPIDASGDVPSHILRRVTPRINLRVDLTARKPRHKPSIIEYPEALTPVVSAQKIEQPKEPILEVVAMPIPAKRDSILREFEDVLSGELDLTLVLADYLPQQESEYDEVSAGMSIETASSPDDEYIPVPAVANTLEPLPYTPPHKIDQLLPRKASFVRAPDLRAHFVTHRHSLASNDIERALRQSRTQTYGSEAELVSVAPSATNVWADVPQARHAVARTKTRGDFVRHWSLSLVIFLSLFMFVAWLSYSRSISVQNNVLRNGSNAVANLEEANVQLKGNDFGSAANSFALAYDDLTKASGTLSKIGASFLTAFRHVPLLNKIGAANNLVEAGQSIAKAGENLSLAFDTLYKADLAAYFDYQNPKTQKPLGTLIREFRDVLVFANQNVGRAQNLLADIDITAIPPEKKAVLDTFQEKIPSLNQYGSSAAAYADLLVKMIGQGKKNYLVLFQNNSELRATGGFPGSYAVITFDNGYLRDIKVDDIYNPDGQMKEKIVPPVPLQHITPTWGMRDANWFADFPTSAEKIESMYRLDGGPKVDGVLAITPDLITDILRVVGPIELPEYRVTLTADNFIAEIQDEIEYGDNRTQPKTILKDLQPKLFDILRHQDKENWVKIIDALSGRLQKKQILAYFNDKSLQETVIARGFDGSLKKTDGDFLSVVYTNIKGSKADAFTDNTLKLITTLKPDGVQHELTINRFHSGGDSKYGFYNRPNPAYVRVYVPRGAILDASDGVDVPSYKTLVQDINSYQRDPDLVSVENTIQRTADGIDVFIESGKTVFGFWLITDPKKSKSVRLSYHVSSDVLKDGRYGLYWQKQSGSEGDTAHMTLQASDGLHITNKTPLLKNVGSALLWDDKLTTDQQFEVSLP